MILTLLNGRAAVTWYSIVHETSDAEVAYDHTHAVCGFANKLTSSSFQPPLTLTESILAYHRKAPVRIEQSDLGPSAQVPLIQRIRDAPTIYEACQILGIEPRNMADIKLLRTVKPTVPHHSWLR